MSDAERARIRCHDLAMKIVAVFALLVGLEPALAKEPHVVEGQPPQAPDAPTRRVFGGQKAKDGQFPFIVYVRLRGSVCTGSLIQYQWVLTAAHCVGDKVTGRETYVIGGRVDVAPWFQELSFGRTPNATAMGYVISLVDKFYVHPSYDNRLHSHDMALLHLRKSLKNPKISLAKLAIGRITTFSYCTVLGFGKVPGVRTNFHLFYATNMKSGRGMKGCPKTKPLSLCVKADKIKGACAGDSGSPLLCQGKVYGVLSTARQLTAQCGAEEELYYAPVFEEMRWILNVSEAQEIEASIKVVLVFVGAVWFLS